MTQYFTAITQQYELVYIVARENEFTMSNISPNQMFEHTYRRDQITDAKFTIHDDITFTLPDVQQKLSLKSVFQGQMCQYFNIQAQAQNQSNYLLRLQFFLNNNIEVQVANQQIKLQLRPQDQNVLCLYIGSTEVNFDFKECQYVKMEKQQFILQDSVKRIKFSIQEEFQKSFLLETHLKCKIQYYQEYVKINENLNRTMQKRAATLVMDKIGIQEMDLADSEISTTKKQNVQYEVTPEMMRTKAVRQLDMLIDDIRNSKLYQLGALLQELIVLQNKLSCNKQSKHNDQTLEKISETLKGIKIDKEWENQESWSSYSYSYSYSSYSE